MGVQPRVVKLLRKTTSPRMPFTSTRLSSSRMLSVAAKPIFYRFLSRLNKVEHVAPPQKQASGLEFEPSPRVEPELTFALLAVSVWLGGSGTGCHPEVSALQAGLNPGSLWPFHDFPIPYSFTLGLSPVYYVSHKSCCLQGPLC